ncbi:MAG: Uma2 family endonuclease, partial [Cyanobacteriota bacterium]|nr:Uma2 family endonuclease [Cyanobacteriota bacterium]
WEEGNIAPQVVFEILSPGNRLKAMAQKLRFYDRHGVEEYYVYDPDDGELIGWLRHEEEDLDVISEMDNWVSPRLGIRFEVIPNDLIIYRPDGEKFLTFVELGQVREREQQRADDAIAQLENERLRAEQERLRAESERQRAEQERQRADDTLAQLETLKAQLRQRGLEWED